jgi:hypothetical protein
VFAISVFPSQILSIFQDRSCWLSFRYALVAVAVWEHGSIKPVAESLIVQNILLVIEYISCITYPILRFV